jgi:hypothetical protein
MAETGRQPYDTLDTALFGSGDARPRPPDSLRGLERAAFVNLITSVRPGSFGHPICRCWFGGLSWR